MSEKQAFGLQKCNPNALITMSKSFYPHLSVTPVSFYTPKFFSIDISLGNIFIKKSKISKHFEIFDTFRQKHFEIFDKTDKIGQTF